MTTLSNPVEDAGGARSRATMRDVAALAGVSLKTVSRVVNRETGVSDELISRVERAAEQLDYRPNLTASNLRRADQRTATIGLLVEDVANPFFADIHRGVEEVARLRGVAVMAASLDRNPEAERDLVEAFAARRVDGLILGPTASQQGYLTRELRSGWPIVCIDRVPRGVSVDVVLTNNRSATRDGVAHLIAHGHRRIAYLGGDSRLSTAHERYDGFLEAMMSAGVPVRPDLVMFDAHNADDALVFARRFLALEDRPTAIFSAQNLITMGTFRALREAGLHREVALVGFDDFLFADLLEPAVTVVAQDPRAMGHLAAEILFRRMDKSHEAVATHIIASRIITRGSGEIRPA